MTDRNINYETELLFKRMSEDEVELSDALISLTEVVEGKKALGWLGNNYNRSLIENAFEQILAYLGKPEKISIESFDNMSETEWEDYLYTFFDKRGFSTHEMELKKGWSKDSIGPILATRNNGDVVALIPDRNGKYHYQNYESGKVILIDKSKESEFADRGICFFRQFPKKSMKGYDLLIFMKEALNRADYINVLVYGLLATSVGMITPVLIKILFSSVQFFDNFTYIVPFMIFMIASAVAVTLFRVVQNQVVNRMSAKVDMNIRAATMERILSLPVEYYKRHATGELAKRIQVLQLLSKALVAGVFTTGLMLVLSVIYIWQIYRLGGSLAVPVTIITILYVWLSVLIIDKKSAVNAETIEYTTKDNALLVSMMNGIQTLKVSASEKRIYTKWLKIFKKESMAQYHPGFFVTYGNVLLTAVTLIGMMAIYFVANENDMFAESYIAFTSVYAMLTAVLLNVQEVIPNASLVRPILEELDVFLEQAPEVKDDETLKEVEIRNVEFDNVSFRYGKDLPLIIKNFSLKIHEGEYVAIVGKSGCGKSTLMRLLLGFEECTLGNVYINGININSINKKSLRRQLGVVMQDSKLFAGSIFKNISISNPGMTEQEAWEAAEEAGIADDIRNMPMQMNTLVDENASCISGGQKQRIIIARALAGNPKLVLFDEATSALDNITQKIVSESLEKIKCTRVVIAHRLSTIKNCDRIIMLEKGEIIESGTYDELIDMNGKFAAMVKRQLL